jgi:hypothetical protein
MEARMDTAAAEEMVDTVMRLRPLPDAAQMKVAQDTLLRPIDRFLAEIFWFWTADNTPDVGLEALARGDTDRAISAWATDAGNSITARHNLAVLYHLMALDDELAVREPPADRTRLARLPVAWTNALSNWRQANADPKTWQALQQRARKHQDVRLTDAFVEEIRGDFAAVLLRLNVRLAITAAERNDDAAAQRNMKAICTSGFEQGVVDQVVFDAIRTIRDRVQQATDVAKGRWEDTPHRAAQIVAEMEKSCAQVLRVLKTVVDALPPQAANKVAGQRDAIHDLVADMMLKGQIAYTNKTNDWPEGIRILERAHKLARGSALRDRLTDDIKLLKEAADAGNDWCAKGYWELPAATIAELEAARELTRVGNFEGALKRLLAMDTSAGQPLRRAAAWCLSVWGVRTGNDALGEYNADTAVRKRLLDNIVKDHSLITRRPTPGTPSYLLPDCPSCKRDDYSGWVNFKLKGELVWMCSRCNDEDDRQLDAQKRVLRPKLTAALERMLLADEIDPGDKGIRRNLEIVRRQHREMGCPAHDVPGLRKRLGAGSATKVREAHVPPAHAADKTCYFCNLRQPDPACGIAVPYWREQRSAATLLSESVTLQEGKVTVPRCKPCRDAHAAFVVKRRQWGADQTARAELEFKQKADRERWEDQQLKDRRIWEADQVNARRRQEAEQYGAIETAVAAAFPYPLWAKLIGGNAVAISAVAGALGGMLLRDGRVGIDLVPLAEAASSRLSLGLGLTEAVLPAALGALIGAAPVGVAAIRSARRANAINAERNALREERKAKLKAELTRLEADWEAEKRAWQSNWAAQKEKYAAEQTEERKQYAAAHPEPRLPAGIRSETQFTDFPTIGALRAAKWNFGTQGSAASNLGSDNLHKAAKGLVAA